MQVAEGARGEQLVRQEMTLYVLRIPEAAYMAADKEDEIFRLYEDMLLAASDVRPEHAGCVHGIANFIYTAFVGVLHQWLATGDRERLIRTTADLIEAAQKLADDRLSTGSVPRRQSE